MTLCDDVTGAAGHKPANFGLRGNFQGPLTDSLTRYLP
jgi:hypothetical protein